LEANDYGIVFPDLKRRPQFFRIKAIVGQKTAQGRSFPQHRPGFESADAEHAVAAPIIGRTAQRRIFARERARARCREPLSARMCRQIVTVAANCSQTAGSNAFKGARSWGVDELAYQIVAVRENETVRCERISVLIAIAKARVWTSEGWQVVITDAEGKTLEPADFDKLLAA